jgi:hypothetical protein
MQKVWLPVLCYVPGIHYLICGWLAFGFQPEEDSEKIMSRTGSQGRTFEVQTPFRHKKGDGGIIVA